MYSDHNKDTQVINSGVKQENADPQIRVMTLRCVAICLM